MTGRKPRPMNWHLLANAPAPTAVEVKPPLVPEDRDPSQARSRLRLNGKKKGKQ